MSHTALQTMLLLTILLPLLLASGLIFKSVHSPVLRLAPWGALPGLLLTLILDQSVAVHIPWVLLGVELRLMPGNGQLFLLFTTVIWLAAGFYARSYLFRQPGRSRFFCYFLLTMSGNLGLVFAQDLMSFYLFFALMSFASYGLIVHEQTDKAIEAARVYIILVVIGEVALFSAFLLTSFSAGSASFEIIRQQFTQVEPRNLIVLLAVIGFGLKAGFVGLHMWLPLAHPVAPTPASAVLSGAIIKAGLLGFIQFLPIGEMTMVPWGQVLIFFGLISAFYGVIIGISQTVPKTVLAYSSISQMGLMTIGVGVGLAAPETAPGILSILTLFALHHGLNKGALFLGVGVIAGCSGNRRRLVWLALFLPALALAGAPLTSGMAAKLLLKSQAMNAPEGWAFLLQNILPLSSLATTLLVGRFLFLLHFQKEDHSSHPSTPGVLFPWTVLIILSVVMPWIYVPTPEKLWSLASLLSTIWPVLLGILLLSGFFLWRSSRTRGGEEKAETATEQSVSYLVSHIPPGDILIPINRLICRLLSLGRWVCNEQLPEMLESVKSTLDQMWLSINLWERLTHFESVLRFWPVSLTILVILGLLMALIGMF